ncbi:MULTISPECIES: DUF5389 family protein [Gallibacterium]|uniref:Membrane protein n=1 Tax=Gallibacterium genomosp. 3 TaxID=505345 RepID=A0A1A7NVP3_9PAST|nr:MULTISPECIES: DUF5389 family protein [Gallibacterium]MDA3979368.1 DUF5389 family protein [Gallibacterium sp. AGMB14963]OBW93571.1 membrane protein [Gallibacterium genomosp. 3]OBX07841.1 membrane protein [Gallibacterium genomosp. 3]
MRKKNNFPEGFSKFSWAIAIFCIPALLWPLSLLLSPSLKQNPNLSEMAFTNMSIFMWSYPLLLFILARIIYKLHQRKPKFAAYVLAICFILFYLAVLLIAVYGFQA